RSSPEKGEHPLFVNPPLRTKHSDDKVSVLTYRFFARMRLPAIGCPQLQKWDAPVRKFLIASYFFLLPSSFFPLPSSCYNIMGVNLVKSGKTKLNR
ncbi:MAG: hypothetical protein ACRCT1_06795, partial [Microcoleaceae cyanobacterium]